jgi:hypothetical protein
MSPPSFLRAFLESPMAEAVTKTPVIYRRSSASGGNEDDDASAARGASCSGAAPPPPGQQPTQTSAVADFVRAVDRPFFLLH